jgi:hypothetical protein
VFHFESISPSCAPQDGDHFGSGETEGPADLSWTHAFVGEVFDEGDDVGHVDPARVGFVSYGSASFWEWAKIFTWF